MDVLFDVVVCFVVVLGLLETFLLVMTGLIG